MKKKSIKNISILSLIILYIIIYKSYIYPQYREYAEYITAAFITIITYIAYLVLGYQKDKQNDLKKNVIIIELIILLGFFSLYYGSGLFLGYLSSPYAFDFSSIMTNIFALLIIIISTEVLRYIMISSNKENKYSRFAITLVITLFEIFITVIGQKIGNYEELFKVSAQTIIPIFAKNYTLSYIIRYAGIKPVLL